MSAEPKYRTLIFLLEAELTPGYSLLANARLIMTLKLHRFTSPSSGLIKLRAKQELAHS